MNRTLSPRTPNPTTPIPMTLPPAKATSRALPNPVRAALVVRTFALVATFMPMNPAIAEHKAPSTNDNATNGEEASSC